MAPLVGDAGERVEGAKGAIHQLARYQPTERPGLADAVIDRIGHNPTVHRWVLSVIALGYLAAAVGWLRTARSALQRARGLEHQGRPAEQWRTLAAKDTVRSLLFFGLAAVTGVEAAQGLLTAGDLLLVLGVGPTALSLGLGRRFERLSAQVEAIEDLAHRRARQAVQRDFFADHFAERLAGADVSDVPGMTLRSLYEPVEGALGGDFVELRLGPPPRGAISVYGNAPSRRICGGCRTDCREAARAR